jgi:hypothetical protein
MARATLDIPAGFDPRYPNGIPITVDIPKDRANDEEYIRQVAERELDNLAPKSPIPQSSPLAPQVKPSPYSAVQPYHTTAQPLPSNTPDIPTFVTNTMNKLYDAPIKMAGSPGVPGKIPSTPADIAGGMSDIIRSGLTLATPAMMSGASPLAAAKMIIPSSLLDYGVTKAAGALGATEGQSNLIGDVVGGAYGFSPKAQSFLGGFFRGASEPVDLRGVYTGTPRTAGGVAATIMGEPWWKGSTVGTGLHQVFARTGAGLRGGYAASQDSPWLGLPSFEKPQPAPWDSDFYNYPSSSVYNAEFVEPGSMHAAWEPQGALPSASNPIASQSVYGQSGPQAQFGPGNINRTQGAVPMPGPAMPTSEPSGPNFPPRELPPVSPNPFMMGPARSPEYTSPSVQIPKMLPPSPENTFQMPPAEGLPPQNPKLLEAPQSFQFNRQYKPVLQPLNPENVNISQEQLAKTAGQEQTQTQTKPVTPPKKQATPVTKEEASPARIEKTVTPSQVGQFAALRDNTTAGDVAEEFGVSVERAEKLLVGLESNGRLQRSKDGFVGTKEYKDRVIKEMGKTVSDNPEMKVGNRESKEVKLGEATKRKELLQLQQLDDPSPAQVRRMHQLNSELGEYKKYEDADKKESKKSNATVQKSESNKAEESGSKSSESSKPETNEDAVIKHDELYEMAKSIGVTPTQLARKLISEGHSVEPSKFGAGDYAKKGTSKPVLTSEQIKKMQDLLAEKYSYRKK